ncbi:autotransporter domain-containing protein [Bradyrhizobium manausense]|nr:autotransporter domain-containing protein [Bradyrhizobium manausense]
MLDRGERRQRRRSDGHRHCLVGSVRLLPTTRRLIASCFMTMLAAGGAFAQNATWLAAPGSADFNTAANWTPAAVPTGTANFGVSNTTSLTISAATTIGGWSFGAGASNYLFTNANALTFTGGGIVVTGGSVGITNNLSIAFTNASSAGNAAITNPGLLAFRDTSRAGSANIANTGILDFADASNAGSAAITSSGGGQLQFRNNANAGSAIVTTNAGSATTFADTSSGGTSRQIVNAGGTLDFSFVTAPGGLTIGSLEGAGSVFLGGTTVTVGGTGLSTVFSGVLQDGGANGGVLGNLTKVGPGALTLTGANTYTGQTLVNGGTLLINGSINAVTVNAGGTLGGSGAVGTTQVNAGGSLAPGNGLPGSSLAVGGNLTFQAGASYVVSLTPATATSTVVNGNATLNGATLVAQFTPGAYVSRQYTLLTATQGVTGTFAGITNVNLPQGTRDTLSYGANTVSLNLLPGFTGYTGLSVNQSNVAATLTNAFNANGGIAGPFFGLTPGGLTQVDGEAGTGAQRVLLDSLSQFLGLMLDPFIGGRSLPTGGGQALGFAPAERPAPPDVAQAFASATKAPGPSPFAQRWTTWAGAYGGGSWADGNGAVGSTAVAARSAGVAAGIDYRVSSDTVIGGALGGGGTGWDLANALGSGKSDAFQLGVYAATRRGPAYVSGAVALANHWFGTNRWVLGDQVTASFTGQSYGGRLEGGYRFATPAGTGITPYGALQAQLARTPAYRETDQTAGLFGLAYAGSNASDVRVEIGSRFDHATTVSSMPLVLRARVAWAHDFVGTPSLGAAFLAVPGTGFTVFGAPIARDSALLSTGAELFITPKWTLLGKVGGELARTGQALSGTGTLRYVW